MSEGWQGTRPGEPKPVQLSDEEACALLGSRHLTASPVLLSQLAGFVSALALEAATLESPKSLAEALGNFCRFHRAEIEALPEILSDKSTPNTH